MLLKPNMVVAKRSPSPASVDAVAQATLRTLQRFAPSAVPGIVFLSGGQNHLTATLHLNAINRLDGARPWKLSFSFGRALQDEALRACGGRPEHVAAAQRTFAHRVKCARAAALGQYTPDMESGLAA